jgi:type IV secretion system protein VirB8
MTQDGTFKKDKAVADTQLLGERKVRQERNRAYILIVFLLVIIALNTISYLFLFPLKTVEAVVVTVDTNTGRVVKTQSATPEKLAAEDWIKQHEAHEYVKARNTADNFDKQRLVDYVTLHSTEQVDQEFRQEITVRNLSSPYLLIGLNGRQSVVVNSISLLEKDIVQVYYETHLNRNNSADTEIKYWVAVFKFTFTGKPKLGLNQRWDNPLGYIVTSYRRDEQLSKPKAVPNIFNVLSGNRSETKEDSP